MVSGLLFAAGMSRTLVCVVSSLITCSIAASTAIAQPGPPTPIVGGTRVPEGRWNDVVAVIGNNGRCSGTLIAPDVVLTAGHCIDIDPYEVITSTTDLARPGGDHIPVKWSRAYPEWTHRYDVGVLMLEHVARPRPRLIAAACHTNDRLLAGAPLTIVGFGLVTPAGTD
ncbi:MAG: trypsin-like serine protease, partial [Deltaproteobacteria bacterium]|nr:trypsin-like serine protease [Deltaproteobacteria bacterium]